MEKGDGGLPGSSKSWNQGNLCCASSTARTARGVFKYKYTNNACDAVGQQDERAQWKSYGNQSCEVFLYAYDDDGSFVSKSEVGDSFEHTKSGRTRRVSPTRMKACPSGKQLRLFARQRACVRVCVSQTCGTVEIEGTTPIRYRGLAFPNVHYQFNADKVELLPTTGWGKTMVRMVFDVSPDDKDSELWLPGVKKPYELVLSVRSVPRHGGVMTGPSVLTGIQ